MTITDNDANQAQISVLTLADTTVNGHTATWQTALPKGHSYTFTESGFSNGTSWSTELPVIDLPDEEAPMADAPKTGDSTGAWILAAGVSSLALVWLAISGKKRRDSDHQA